jgi:hypothetical protein
MDMQHIAQRYIDTFNETDPQRRRALIAELWTPDGRYVDPNHALQGWDEIDEAIAHAQATFPNHVFKLGGNVDGHHETARFAWHFNAPGDPEPMMIGFDVIVVDDQRIRQVWGFLDKVPAA